MNGLTVDASVVLSWHFRDESTPPPGYRQRLVEGPVFVPSHFFAEVANGVAIAERQGRTAPDQLPALVELLEIIDPEVDGQGAMTAFERVLPLARAHRLTIYDALYLELTERRGLALATRDGPLARAARAAGVEVLEEEKP